MRVLLPRPFAPTPYQTIKEISEQYHKEINDASYTLSQDPTKPQLIIANEPVGFYISKNEMASINKFATHIKFEKYIVLFGIEKTTGFLTASIMGADISGNILPEHKTAITTEPFAPQETWPDRVGVNLSDNIQTLKTFMQ